MALTHLSLFSGIGGIDLAAEWAGFETIGFVECEPYCQQVLNKHWPDVPIIGDVKDVNRERIAEIMANTTSQRSGRTDRNTIHEGGRTSESGAESIQENSIRQDGIAIADSQSTSFNGQSTAAITPDSECVGWQKGAGERIQSEQQVPIGQDTRNICPEITLISGGFPCQPHSVAGKRRGSSDERNLWPEFRRIVSEIRPRWVLGENVPGLFTSDSRRYFGTILSDLAEMGYSVGWATYGAVDVGALHRRNRVFILGYDIMGDPEHSGLNAPGINGMFVEGSDIPLRYSGIMPDWAGGECRQPSPLTEHTKTGEIERNFCGVAYGVSRRVDRLKALGNAVVPQQVSPILKAIADYENGEKSK